MIVTNENGCTSSQAIAIEVHSLPQVFVVNTIELNATQLPYTYNMPTSFAYTYTWETGEIGNSILMDEFGTYAVTITNTNGCQVQHIIELIDLELEEEEDVIEVTGIGTSNNNVPAINLHCYPNPVQGQLHISLQKNGQASTSNFNQNNNSSSQIIISNTAGKIVYQAALNNGNTTINMQLFASGMYLVSLQNGAEMLTKKVMKY